MVFNYDHVYIMFIIKIENNTNLIALKQFQVWLLLSQPTWASCLGRLSL